MAWIAALIGAGAAGYSADKQNQALGSASAAQQGATAQSLAEQQRQFDIAQQNMAPWLQAGRGALTAQQQLMGLAPGSQNQLATLANTPGYQFRLQQGQQALDAGLAARGGMGSGRSMQAGVDYNQNFAANEYGNRLNQLAGLSGSGQSAAGNMGQMGMNYAQNYGNTLQGGANALGAAQLAAANATQSSILGGANLGMSLYNANKQAQQPNFYQTQSSVSPKALNTTQINYSNPNSSYWGVTQ